MAEKTIYEEWMADDEMARMIAQEKFIMSATEAICDLLERKKISRKELATRLGKTKGYVSQVLGGSRNITLRTLADIIHCLGHSASIHIDQERGKPAGNQFVETWELKGNRSDDYYDCEDHMPVDFEEMAG